VNVTLLMHLVSLVAGLLMMALFVGTLWTASNAAKRAEWHRVVWYGGMSLLNLVLFARAIWTP
jgi:hypothetical protein